MATTGSDSVLLPTPGRLDAIMATEDTRSHDDEAATRQDIAGDEPASRHAGDRPTRRTGERPGERTGIHTTDDMKTNKRCRPGSSWAPYHENNPRMGPHQATGLRQEFPGAPPTRKQP